MRNIFFKSPVPPGLALAGGIFCLLAFTNLSSAVAYTLEPGKVQVVFQGTMEFPAGSLYEAEKKLNPLLGTVMYEDGTIKQSEMHQEGWQYGFWGEYSLTEEFGVQAGMEFRSITQKVSAGGGNYEEKIWAEGTLLSYLHPFLGASYYLWNLDEFNVALTARAGMLVDGKLYPEITTLQYFEETPRAYPLTGYTLGGGLSVSWVYGFLVLGGAFMVTDNLARLSEKYYPDLDQSFSFMSYDLNAYIGVMF